MAEEVMFCCSNGMGDRSVKITAWGPSKGTVKRTYSCEAQGGGAALALLGNTYLLCALKSLPFIYAWHLRKEQVHTKMSCPGVVRTLATTPDTVYCAAAIAEKIYVWQVSTGRLLAVVSQHYQPVSVLEFTDDGLWLISGGEDGRVLVWSLRRLLSQAFDTSGLTLPHCEGVPIPAGPRPPVLHQAWSDHTLPVTAVHCGAGGLQARTATASLDQTCKLYDMASGRLLCSLLFGFSLTAVTMDMAEQWLFVGGATGRLAQVNLFLQRTSPAHNMSAGVEAKERFRGHMQ
jgi:pre-rRNA-processing protein IPI3